MADLNQGMIFSPTFETTDGLNARWKGYLYVAEANTLNMFDEPITTELKLRGGSYQLLDNPSNPNANIGDYIEFSVIDKDNVLGYFSAYGLVVGQDVLELKKFVVKEYIVPHSNRLYEFKTNGGFDIIPGLYLRTTYNNMGNSDVNIKVGSYHYEG